MKQMHKLLMTLGILSAFQLITACGRDWRSELEPTNRISNIVVKCKYEPEIDADQNFYRLNYRVTEIWRDESNGLFTYGVGDVINKLLEGKTMPDDFPLAGPIPDEAVIFTRLDDSMSLNFSPTSISYIYSKQGWVGTFGSVEEVKQIIVTTTSLSGDEAEALSRSILEEKRRRYDEYKR